MVQKLQHILLLVTEDHGGKNGGNFDVWRTKFLCHSCRFHITLVVPINHTLTAPRKTYNFTQHCQVLNFQIPRNWDGRWQGTEWPSKKCHWRNTLSAKVPFSRNLEIKNLTVLCEIESLSGCQLLKSAAMTRKLRSPDIKITSILSSVIFGYLQQNVL